MSRAPARLAWIVAAIAAVGCHRDEPKRVVEPGAEQARRPPGPAVEQHAAPSGRAVAEPPPVREAEESKRPAASTRAPAGGCVEAGDEVVVWPRPGPSAVAAFGDAFVVVGYAASGEGGGGEQLFVVRVAPGGTTMPITTAAVEPPVAPGRRGAGAPGLLVEGNDAWIARIDGAAQLGVAYLELDQPGTPLRFTTVAKGVDARFHPALARIGDGLSVAWVDGSGTPMHVKVTRFGPAGEPGQTRDVTPEALGGAAPVFVDGASPPALVFMDPRSGISPIVRVPMGPDGTPGTGAVVLSVGPAPEPPELAAAMTPTGVAVGYTAIGSAATTAVGLVRFDAPTAAPVPLVKGTGYGPLGVAAVALGHDALFVSEAPTARAKGAPRVLQARLVGDAGPPGPILALHGGGTAEYPAVARGEDGTVAVAYAGDSQVRTAFLHCGPSQR